MHSAETIKSREEDMWRERRIFICCLTLISSMFVHSTAYAQDRDRKPYSWMLPKTVIDVGVVYSFKKCIDADDGLKLSFNVTPTLTPLAVPDLFVGELQINPKSLESLLQDRTIALTMFSGSHILSSIGSKPTDQTAAIIGNILGGVAKLGGIIFGVAVSETEAQKVICGDAQKTAETIKGYKDKVNELQDQMAKNDLDETTLRADPKTS
jgi:hypothetical protein